jgi:hypothetical protein
MRYFHVSSVSNRESIAAHGLDSSRMGAARGIAGSKRPEVKGVFLSFDEFAASFFIRMNSTGGPVDLWAVQAASGDEWVETDTGFSYVAGTIAPNRVTLVRRDIPASDW